MKYSSKYHLYLPEDTDPVKVSDLNANFEKLESVIADNITSEVSGTLTLNAIQDVTGANKESYTTLNLGKPIKKISFYFHGYVLGGQYWETTIGSVDGPTVIATEASGATSGGSFASGSITRTFSASIPKLTGSSSVTVTMFISTIAASHLAGGKITYAATLLG